jgi:hypothetical protein
MEELSSVRTRPDLLIPVGDETVAATRYEPTDVEGPVPSLVMHIPYHKDDQITYGAYDPTVRYLAGHGYEVVVSDVLGTGASSGRKDDSLTRAEAAESAAVVEWVAEQSWCDGSVGMFGKSYGGATCLKAAAERPRGLKAIVPIHAPHTGYRDTYEGGTFAMYGMGGHWTPLMQALQALPPTRRDEGRWSRVWRERLDGLADREPWLFTYLEHETHDEYWHGREIPVERIDVPTFAVSGWRDSYPATTVEFIESIDAPTRLLLGPWRHTMPHRGRETAIDFRRQVLEWFDYHLKGIENGADEHAPVAFWTETGGGGREEEGVWRERDRWPTDGDEAMSFAVAPDGLVRTGSYTEGVVDRHYDVDHTVGVDSFDVDAPPETTPDDVRSLCYETPTLDTPVEFTGTGSATVRIRAESPDPIVAVRVIDVSPDGDGTLVTRGILRAKCRDGFQETSDLEAGEEYELDVPLKPTSHLFEKGHRIRVAISGAMFPVALPTRNGDAFALVSTPEAPTCVSISGKTHGAGGPAFPEAFEMSGPDEAVPPTPESVTDSDSTWSVTRHRHDDAVTVATTARSTIDLPHADRMTYAQEIEASVEADDASSASVARTTEITVEYPTETVVVEASSRAARDQSTATTVVTVDGERVFERTWTRP